MQPIEQTLLLHSLPVVCPGSRNGSVVAGEPTCSERTIQADLLQNDSAISPEIEEYAFDNGISFMRVDEDFYLVSRFLGHTSLLTTQALLDAIHAPQPALWIERLQVETANRRARQRGLLANVTVSEWLATLNHFHYQCVYCGCDFITGTMTLDHFIPLALGGPSTIWNCLPACERCNTSKNDRHPDDCFINAASLSAIHAYIDPLMPQFLSASTSICIDEKQLVALR